MLIVEDERVAARGLEATLRRLLGARIVSVRIEGTLTASECFLLDNPVDLLLLDLNLNGDDGMQLLRLAAGGSFQTIIVSANTDRAVQAFEYGVIDFVPKPVSEQRLARALQRFEAGLPASAREMQYVAVRKDDSAELIALKDVTHFEGADNYVLIHARGGIQERHRKTMDSLMHILPANFLRIHRSYIVNMEFASQLHAESGGRYDLEVAGQKLPVSRQVYRELRDRF